MKKVILQGCLVLVIAASSACEDFDDDTMVVGIASEALVTEPVLG